MAGPRYQITQYNDATITITDNVEIFAAIKLSKIKRGNVRKKESNIAKLAISFLVDLLRIKNTRGQVSSV